MAGHSLRPLDLYLRSGIDADVENVSYEADRKPGALGEVVFVETC